MKQYLFDLYNSCKFLFAEAIIREIKVKGEKIELSPYIRISLPRDNDEFFEDITEIQYDDKEDCWFVHNFITETNLMTNEYWTPLRDLTFDELFKIAERL